MMIDSWQTPCWTYSYVDKYNRGMIQSVIALDVKEIWSETYLEGGEVYRYGEGTRLTKCLNYSILFLINSRNWIMFNISIWIQNKRAIDITEELLTPLPYPIISHASPKYDYLQYSTIQYIIYLLYTLHNNWNMSFFPNCIAIWSGV